MKITYKIENDETTFILTGTPKDQLLTPFLGLNKEQIVNFFEENLKSIDKSQCDCIKKFSKLLDQLKEQLEDPFIDLDLLYKLLIYKDIPENAIEVQEIQ